MRSCDCCIDQGPGFPPAKPGAGSAQARHWRQRGAGGTQAVEVAARQAGAQLRLYLMDEALASQYPPVRFTGIWEMAWRDTVGGDVTPEQARMEAS